jgi:hypothetical protein
MMPAENEISGICGNSSARASDSTTAEVKRSLESGNQNSSRNTPAKMLRGFQI